jgi:DNA repair protein RadA/Sms
LKLSIQQGIEFGTSIQSVTIPDILRKRITTGLDYMTIAYGGEGITPTSVTLFTGAPGSGKTSMMLSTANSLVANGSIVVYNSCEESVYQLKMHTEKLKLSQSFLMSEENSVQEVLKNCDKIKKRYPKNYFVLIIDSLQTLHDGTNNSSDEKCLEMITNWCKGTGAAAIVINQVGKDGKFTGKNTLAHMVDGLLDLSIETSKKSSYIGCRVLEMQKHRFGKSHIQIFLKFKPSGFSVIGITGDPDDF